VAGGNTDPSPLPSELVPNLIRQMSKSRNWCFTLNNPDDSPLIGPTNGSLFIACKEIGESGTPHYQGYVEFRNPVALTCLRSWNLRGHYEIRKGTQSEAVRYCVKGLLDDSETTTGFSALPLIELRMFGLVYEHLDDSLSLDAFLESLSKKKTSKLIVMKQLIDNGATDKDLAEHDFETWCRSHRALTHYRMICIEPRDWPMEIIVIYGPTGTGKSRYCQDTFTDCYWKQRGKWWDNYGQHEVCILDEFYGWLQWDVLLRLCDRYPLLLESKGGQIQFSSKTIVFTSNTDPCKWYKGMYFEAFIRRVSKWIFMPELGIVNEFTEYRLFANELNDYHLTGIAQAQLPAPLGLNPPDLSLGPAQRGPAN